MFALIESSPALRHGSDWAPRAASFAAHAALIAAAVLATQRVVDAAPPAIIEQTMPWVVPPPKPDLPVSSSATAPTTPAPTWSTVPAPPVNIATEIPPPGPGEIPPGPMGEGLPGNILTATPGILPGGSAPIDARYVEEPPVMLAHPAINYPEVLRQAGIEGRVLVEAVLDTLGRAEPLSLRVTASPHQLFDREALSVVAGSRFRPGRSDGRAVRVRIQVPVTFSIRR